MSYQFYRALGRIGTRCLDGTSNRGYSNTGILRVVNIQTIRIRTGTGHKVNPQLVPSAFLSTSKKDRDTIAAPAGGSGTTNTKDDNDPTSVTGKKVSFSSIYMYMHNVSI